MQELGQAFEERLQEIGTYLEFLEGVENAVRSGPPRIGTSGTLITVQQQRILYSGVFLQLYNLVEATIVNCLNSITETALRAGTWFPGDLTNEIRSEWVRVMAKTHTDLNYQNRLKSAVELCNHLVSPLPVSSFKLESGKSGNWDDTAICKITDRLGITLEIKPETDEAIKRSFKDERGPLKLVKDLRNSLAHGSISFAECGQNLTVTELRDLTNRIAGYLREVVQAFATYIENHEYLEPAKRPVRARAGS
uniref:MAE-28990/MAE-18760-like HEPN domain-containing protein n=1 Tax=Candidatus Kentrum sp. DK TaxID=2126562 RepID=A0A450T3D4_9GAMM|nr:MAG: hypothetical protein BECKDK2373B_GA0170837_10978 [Candidatus Kentron sp. DK]